MDRHQKASKRLIVIGRPAAGRDNKRSADTDLRGDYRVRPRQTDLKQARSRVGIIAIRLIRSAYSTAAQGSGYRI